MLVPEILKLNLNLSDPITQRLDLTIFYLANLLFDLPSTIVKVVIELALLILKSEPLLRVVIELAPLILKSELLILKFLTPVLELIHQGFELILLITTSNFILPIQLFHLVIERPEFIL